MTLSQFRDMVNKYCEEHPQHLNWEVTYPDDESISKIDTHWNYLTGMLLIS